MFTFGHELTRKNSSFQRPRVIFFKNIFIIVHIKKNFIERYFRPLGASAKKTFICEGSVELFIFDPYRFNIVTDLILFIFQYFQ